MQGLVRLAVTMRFYAAEYRNFMAARFRLCIIMISQKYTIKKSDINEKTSIIYYVIYEEKLLYMAFGTVTMKKT